MANSSDITLKYAGSRHYALLVAQKSIGLVPGYRQFLIRHGIKKSPKVIFDDLPVTDKENYCFIYPYRNLVPAEHWNRVNFVLRSSGFSGRPFYWPQLKNQYQKYDRQLEKILTGLFQIQKKRTLAIVGLALGSWIGGDLVSWVIKNIALRCHYPLTAFVPGNQHDEILDIINRAADLPDQILIFLCPSAINHLFLLAGQKKVKLPYHKLRFVVIGEPFSEDFRQSIAKRCKTIFPEIVMASVYGAADTGIIGIESISSIALNRLLLSCDQVRQALKIDHPLPNLYHIYAPDAFIETINKEIILTKWQGVPLVRYNLHDRGEIFGWKKVVRALSRMRLPNETEKIKSVIINRPNMPDLIAVYGRSDGTIFLCGTNITEAMLQSAMEGASLSKFATGNFESSVSDRRGSQKLCWDIELHAGIRATGKLKDLFYRTLVKRLGEVQPEFAFDYKNIYSKFDAHTGQRIFDIQFHPWPALQKRHSIKRRIIIRKS